MYSRDSSRLEDEADTQFQRRRQRERGAESQREQRREAFADDLGIDEDDVEARQLDDRGERVGFVPTDDARDELAERRAEDDPFVEPDDLDVRADPEAGTEVRLREDRRDVVADRVREGVASESDFVEPGDVDPEVTRRGVEDVDVDEDAVAGRQADELLDTPEVLIEGTRGESAAEVIAREQDVAQRVVIEDALRRSGSDLNPRVDSPAAIVRDLEPDAVEASLDAFGEGEQTAPFDRPFGSDSTIADAIETADETADEREQLADEDPQAFLDEVDTDSAARVAEFTAREQQVGRAEFVAEREARQQVADQVDGIDVTDVETSVEDGEVQARIDDDAADEVAREQAREQLADELGADPDDVELEREGDQFVGVVEGADRRVTGDPDTARTQAEQILSEAEPETRGDPDVARTQAEQIVSGVEIDRQVDASAASRSVAAVDPAVARVDAAGDAREQFRQQAADDLGVRPDDVAIEADGADLVARPDEGGSIDPSVGVSAIPFAGASFGADDVRDFDISDVRPALEREAGQASEAVDRATILPRLDTTPGARALDFASDFEVTDIPGAGAQIGADEMAAVSVTDIPGAGAQIGGDDIRTAGETAASDAETQLATTSQPVREFDVADIPGAGAEIGADDIQTVVDDVSVDVDSRDAGPSPAEAALAAGAAGVVTPEPITTTGGAALATVAAGALVIDGVRRSEIETPEPGELIGGGVGVGTEIDTPESREIRSELDVGSDDVAPAEFTVPADGQAATAEIETPQQPTDTTGEVDVPAVEAAGVEQVARERVGEEEQERFVIDGGVLDDTGPLVEVPPEDRVAPGTREQIARRDDIGQEVVDREPVRFPADEASVAEVTEVPQFEPALAESAAPTASGRASQSDVDFAGADGADTAQAMRADIDATTGLDARTGVDTRPDTDIGLDSPVDSRGAQAAADADAVDAPAVEASQTVPAQVPLQASPQATVTQPISQQLETPTETAFENTFVETIGPQQRPEVGRPPRPPSFDGDPLDDDLAGVGLDAAVEDVEQPTRTLEEVDEDLATGVFDAGP